MKFKETELLIGLIIVKFSRVIIYDPLIDSINHMSKIWIVGYW